MIYKIGRVALQMMLTFLIEQMLMILTETNIEWKIGFGHIEFEIAVWQPGINMQEALETWHVCEYVCVWLRLEDKNFEIVII